MRRSIYQLLLLLVLFSWIGNTLTVGQSLSPQDIVRRVAAKLIADTDFRFEVQKEHPAQDGSFVINFSSRSSQGGDSLFGARSVFFVEKQAQLEVLLGISYPPGTIEVRINGHTVLQDTSAAPIHFLHIDYGLFEYHRYIRCHLRQGENDCRIAFRPAGEESRMFIGVLDPGNGLSHPDASVRSPHKTVEKGSHPFLILGPLRRTEQQRLWQLNVQSDALDSALRSDGRASDWRTQELAEVHTLPGKLALQDWRYFTGTFLDALLMVSEVFSGFDFKEYVDRHLDFFLNHYELINWERIRSGLRDSPFGHFFRFRLLDDMGMQCVPLLERIRGKSESSVPLSPDGSVEWTIIQRAVSHIMNGAVRLSDDTFARYVPDTLTVWADDLFMGTVLLARYGNYCGQTMTIDEAVKQVKQFDHHLRDSASGLYWHGWFNRISSHSSTKWGRANGWTMMAKLEILDALDSVHLDFLNVLKIFREHAHAIKKYQADDGRWHQVLDDTATYLETSATAMFVRVFATGVLRGWLDRTEYDTSIRKGWKALGSQIGADGSVRGIVPGTPIMYSDAEYENHKPRLNDPRGLGAIFYAAAAMAQYEERFGRSR